MESHFDSGNYADISVIPNNDQDQNEASTAGLVLYENFIGQLPN